MDRYRELIYFSHGDSAGISEMSPTSPLENSSELRQLTEEAYRCEARLMQPDLADDEFMDLIEELRAIRRRVWFLIQTVQI